MNNVLAKWKLLIWPPQNAVHLKSEDIRRIQKIIRNIIHLFFEDRLEVLKLQLSPGQSFSDPTPEIPKAVFLPETTDTVGDA